MESTVEKTSAACAMEWSIRLERSLRSKIPGKAIEGILEIGQKLERWISEPNPSIAEHKMLGLIHGEDKLFLNSIFLRLADAFRLGDKQTKICVVRVFLSLRKRSRKIGDEGFLCKDKLENYQELLRRVKIVFDSGDAEERALALGLFGCWVNIAKDSAHIRYMILSSLVSCDVLEVRASLFAGGCFSEVADDFASVFLEMLVNILFSCETASSVRLAAGRAFAKLRHPFLLADRAYKTGMKLALDSSEDFAAVMLISLSKIASKWTLLVPAQIDVIFSFLNDKTSLELQLTALRCLHVMLARGVGRLTLYPEAFQNLLNIMNESESPLLLRCEALKILYKISPCYLPAMPDMKELDVVSKLLRGVKHIPQNSFLFKRPLAFRVLVDISKRIREVSDSASDGASFTLASQLVLMVSDHILLVINLDAHQSYMDLKDDIKSLLELLFNLVKENAGLTGLVVDKVCVYTENLVTMLEINESKHPDEATEVGRETETFLPSKVMLSLSKVVLACLEDHPDEVSTNVLNKLKLLVDNVCRCSLFDVVTHTVYFLLLHSFIKYSCMWHEFDKVGSLNRSSGLPCDDLLSYDTDMLGREVVYAQKVLGRKDNWSSYKIGKYAAKRGLWSAANFIFEQLMATVQSEFCNCWLKTLSQVSLAEKQIELLNRLHSQVNVSDREEGTACKIDLHNSIKTLVEACKSYHLAERTLATTNSDLIFCFQRWLLILRAKVLRTVSDVINLVHTSLLSDTASRNGQFERNQKVGTLVRLFTQVSIQFKNLALEFDLLATSFFGIDRKSVMIILVFSLSCSLLAFSTFFACFIPEPDALDSTKTHNWEEPLSASLIQDLVGRLWQLDLESCTILKNLLKVIQGPESFSLPCSRKGISGTCSEARGIVKICRYAVTRTLVLQNEARKIQDEESRFSIYKDGLQILQKIISMWMGNPFQIPSHFFRVRPCLSCELYVTNEEGTNIDGLSVIPGFDLPLNLCLQLRNMPPALPAQPIKFYCILCCTRSLEEPAPTGENNRQKELSIPDWGDVDMIDLQRRLLHYVTGSKNIRNMQSTSLGGDNWVLYEFLLFQPNRRGQGFSTCLLNISAFPVGSYRIKWLCCLIDNRTSYWNLLPLNAGPVFHVLQSPSCR